MHHHTAMLCAALLVLLQLAHAAVPLYNSKPFAQVLNRRQAASNDSDLTVDLGYERYQGISNSTTGLNTWLGVRYAAAPTGQNRWQPPKAPNVSRDQVQQANAFASKCPQSPDAPIAPDYNYTGSEDCLFLSVYAPPNANDLPVFVWIHGGGYGAGDGTEDLSMIVNTNNGSFIGVAIQYRLGAFGFLSSDEVMRYGAVNAGLLDQHFALQWVQTYIHLFGGDPSKVTISGESAGGGSVMLQGMAFDGYLGDSLFRNIHAASPYLPQQFGYADFVPSQSYYAFAAAVGCFGPPALPQTNISQSIFRCLVGKDTQTLQNASAILSGSGRFGTWGFLPVTDGVFIKQLPSQQLLEKKLNGVNLLVGNNANEGPAFTPQDVNSSDDFVNFITNSFPLFTSTDIDKTLVYYPVSSVSTDSSSSLPRFATNGTTPPLTALDESTYGTGPQQAANNLYAETTFVCPSYWMAEAYTGSGRKAYKYQYSGLVSQHGADVAAYFGPARPDQGTDFVKAIMTMLGNFIVHDNPSISSAIASGGNASDEASTSAATMWPAFSVSEPLQLNLNTTGGVVRSGMSFAMGQPNVTITTEPGIRNSFQLVDAFEWEGGRGRRCDFWRSVGKVVPE